MLNEIITKYIKLLAETKYRLEKLKSQPVDRASILSGMETLPELKERVILTVGFLEDLKKLKDNE